MLTIIALLEVAAKLLPEIADAVPIIEQVLSGGSVELSDMNRLQAITDTLNARIERAVIANNPSASIGGAASQPVFRMGGGASSS